MVVFSTGSVATNVYQFPAKLGLLYEIIQEAQLSPSNLAMRLVSSNLANYHATVQKLLIRQVLTEPMV